MCPITTPFDDLGDLLRVLSMGNHARPESPHQLFQMCIRELKRRQACQLRSLKLMEDAANNIINRNKPNGTACAIQCAIDAMAELRNGMWPPT